MTPARAKPRHLESIEQRLFVQRVRLDPRTRDLPACAIPNGGRRGPREAAILKAEGVSAGAPDWVLMASRGAYIGLALEFKGPTGRVSPAQAAWHASLRHELWAVYIVKSAQEAWDILIGYLDGRLDGGTT
jgi:hypothetical protein